MRGAQREAGQAMVENAILSIVFFTLLLFVVDGGRILWNYVTVADAARIGARYAVVHGSKSTAPVGPGNYTALVQNVRSAIVGLTTANLTVTATWTPNNSPGSSVTVDVTYLVQPITGIFWRGQTLTLRARSVMVIQN